MGHCKEAGALIQAKDMEACFNSEVTGKYWIEKIFKVKNWSLGDWWEAENEGVEESIHRSLVSDWTTE